MVMFGNKGYTQTIRQSIETSRSMQSWESPICDGRNGVFNCELALLLYKLGNYCACMVFYSANQILLRMQKPRREMGGNKKRAFCKIMIISLKGYIFFFYIKYTTHSKITAPPHTHTRAHAQSGPCS